MIDFVGEIFIRGVFVSFALEESFNFVDKSDRGVIVVRRVRYVCRDDPELRVS